MPDDIDDDKYIEIPDKRDLNLGQRLVFRFIDEYLPEKLDSFFLHTVFGGFAFFAIMYLLFQSIFTWAAPAMDAVEFVLGAMADAVVPLIGNQLFRRWVLPFEITALLLIVAAAGAIALAFFRDDDEVES